MSIINKPDYKIFAHDAKTGETETFPDILRGWGVTIDRTAGKPPMEWFNALGKRADEWMMYLSQRGIVEWDKAVEYPQSAVVQHAGKFYVAKKQTRGQQPDNSQNEWMLFVDAIGIAKSITDALNTKQDIGDYATNAALNAVNDNANSRLEKAKNGADIQSKPEFVKNLGFIEQQTGSSATTVMSQRGATQAFALKQSREAFKSGNHTIVSDDEYAYTELINSAGERLSLETLPENEAFSGNIILRNADSKVVSVIKIPRKFDTTFATLADLTEYQPSGNYATQAELATVEKKSVQAFRYSSMRVIKTVVNNWSPAVEGEFVIGIRTSFDGAGTWIITEVKVVKLQTFADGKWVNIQNA
ncbi:hypothetical protein XIS1_520048 [Xenorhabdus innexi]|uniref:Tail fiber protein n=1 Tax=Xenorhabdus innexi TaxID=290109 RepID=A0A1N6MZ68_9GAMM|nr:hypothetical protein [Xenorhabdus innexi]SIP74135.1 hypothetical protein XIS1_520048 [Xenorhabdus innexi]